MASSFVVLVAAVASFGWMGHSFLPEFNEGSLTISAVTIPGTSLDESDRLGSALERVLLKVPEVASTARRTGRTELDEHLQGVESAEIDVRLEIKERSKEEVLAEIRERTTLIPGTNINIGQPISHRIDHMLSGTRSNVAVKIFGDDLRTLRALAAQVEQAMRNIPGVVDLASERQTDIPTVTVRFRRNALARYGMQAGTAAEALRTVFLGLEVGAVLEGQVAFPLVVRYESGRPEELETIRQTMIDTPSGARVPLSAIADIREDRSPNVVTRENVQRKIVVSCNVVGGDLRGVVTDIQSQIADEVKLPQGYRIEYGGQFESEAGDDSAHPSTRRACDRWDPRFAGNSLPFRDRCAHHHVQPSFGSDRGRHRRLSRGGHRDGGFPDRLYHVVWRRRPQRHHAHLPHQASDDGRGGYGFSRGGDPRCVGAPGADPDDGSVYRHCPPSGQPRFRPKPAVKSMLHSLWSLCAAC